MLELLPTLETGIDLVYFDPPYAGSHADYQAFYHLLETFTRYWTDKTFVNATRRYEPPLWSGFDKKSEIEESLEKMFALSTEIPVWLISYNDRSYPPLEKMTSLLKRYREVEVELKPYLNSVGGKGSVAGSNEILFICRPKLKVFMPDTLPEKRPFAF